MRAFFFFTVLFLVVGASNMMLAGEPQSLKEWDSVAFSAYESNQENVLEIADKFKDASLKEAPSIYQVNAFTLLGIINKNKGYYVSSVEYYNEALEVAIAINDQGRISACYNNIGSVYQIQENFDKALYYFKKSLDIEESLNTPLQKSIRLYNLGEVYRELDSLTLALSHFNSSLIIEKKFNNDEGIVYALLGIADIYLKLDRAADANISLEEVKPYLSKSNIETEILYNARLGEVYFLQGKLDLSLSKLRKAKKLSEKHDTKVHLMDIYEKEIEVKTAKDKQEKNTSEKDERTTSFLWYLSIPIVLITLFFIIKLNLKPNKVTPKSDQSKTQNDSITFAIKNNKGNGQLEINISNIICFEANDNYVITHFLTDDDKKVRSMDRISLKKVSESLDELGVCFERVHKSFLINPKYVTEIKGRAQAYKLTLNHLEIEIPVSRKYDISGLKR